MTPACRSRSGPFRSTMAAGQFSDSSPRPSFGDERVSDEDGPDDRHRPAPERTSPTATQQSPGSGLTRAAAHDRIPPREIVRLPCPARSGSTATDHAVEADRVIALRAERDHATPATPDECFESPANASRTIAKATRRQGDKATRRWSGSAVLLAGSRADARGCRTSVVHTQNRPASAVPGLGLGGRGRRARFGCPRAIARRRGAQMLRAIVPTAPRALRVADRTPV